jgi:S-adenosylmethionine-diacylgycerolhomoserine-N-methlytransferase
MSRDNNTDLQRYYRWHAAIYDATRWSFLFGRDQILRDIAMNGYSPRKILEIGCGTGRNLEKLSAIFPSASLCGLDLSGAMLARARKRLGQSNNRVEWREQAYSSPVSRQEYDLVLFSYSLSMFNPGWETAIRAAMDDLAPRGRIAVVDFESTSLGWFRRWMGVNHVRMDGHLLPLLSQVSEPIHRRIDAAYGGCWKYLRFVGKRAGT